MAAGGMRYRGGPTRPSARGSLRGDWDLTGHRDADHTDVVSPAPVPLVGERPWCGGWPWPGLVVEWARSDGDWRARVIYLVGDVDTATIIETWIDAAQLRPA